MLSPVKWTTSVEQTKPGEAILVMTANIEKEWHIYSQHTPDGGPMPMTFTFEPDKNYELVGKVVEPKPHKSFDETFEVDVLSFDGIVVMRQKVKLKGDGFKINGSVIGQVCKEVCILFDTTLTFTIGKINSVEKSDAGEKDSSLTVAEQDSALVAAEQIGSQKKHSVDEMIAALEPGCGEAQSEETDLSFWGIFLAGMLGGFLALLTPCVFPMIPLTVSFFTKRSKTRQKGIFNATVYAVSIIVIYVLLGLLITVSFGSDALN
jgi:thiol:disulfide interchange protein